MAARCYASRAAQLWCTSQLMCKAECFACTCHCRALWQLVWLSAAWCDPAMQPLASMMTGYPHPYCKGP